MTREVFDPCDWYADVKDDADRGDVMAQWWVDGVTTALMARTDG